MDIPREQYKKISVSRHLIPNQQQGFFLSQFQGKYPAIDIILPFNSLKPI